MSSAAMALAKALIVMENDDSTKKEMEEGYRLYGFKVHFVGSESEALKAADSAGCRFFVLDADMGKSRSQEGLNALERLKKRHPTAFVAIYTQYTDRFEDMASRLGADAFQKKSSDKRQDISSLVRRIKQHMAETGTTIQCEPSEISSIAIPRTPEEDPNFITYQELSSNREWLRANVGAYAGIVDGQLVATNGDRSALLKELRARFPGKRRFITKIGVDSAPIEIPSLFSLDEP
jgi:ActR/RegA family two-component response regulator